MQLWLVQASGWVAFDDLSLNSKDPGTLRYYYFGSQRIALRDASGLQYLHTDHLNSTTLLTNNEGNPLPSAPRYYAYGRERSSNSVQGLPTEYAFTGQRYDNATGLIYMNARYYDPEMGVFISPDTIVPDAGNVFDYNRYMFVRGNPMKYNDPSGHCIWDGCILELVVIGAAVGAIANATGNVSAQVITNMRQNDMSFLNAVKNVNTTDIAIAAGYGAIAGGVSVVPGIGTTTALAIGGFLGGAQYVTSEIVAHDKNPSEVSATGTLLAAGLSVAGTKLQGSMPGMLSATTKDGIEYLGAETGKAAEAYGGKQFAQVQNGALFAKQQGYLISRQYLRGFAVSNAPLAAGGGGCGGWLDLTTCIPGMIKSFFQPQTQNEPIVQPSGVPQ